MGIESLALHERLQIARQRAGEPSQGDVGQALGVRGPTVSAWENHITKAWKNLEALCRYYEARGVSPGWIIAGSGPIMGSPSDEDMMDDLDSGFDDTG